jgi:hypothetical protein
MVFTIHRAWVWLPNQAQPQLYRIETDNTVRLAADR